MSPALIVIIYQLGFWFDGEVLHVRQIGEGTWGDRVSFEHEQRLKARRVARYDKRRRDKARELAMAAE